MNVLLLPGYMVSRDVCLLFSGLLSGLLSLEASETEFSWEFHFASNTKAVPCLDPSPFTTNTTIATWKLLSRLKVQGVIRCLDKHRVWPCRGLSLVNHPWSPGMAHSDLLKSLGWPHQDLGLCLKLPKNTGYPVTRELQILSDKRVPGLCGCVVWTVAQTWVRPWRHPLLLAPPRPHGP